MSRKFLKYVAILSIIVLTASVLQASAHDWYSNSCCSMHDCHPIDSCSEIIEKAKGYLQWDSYTFSPEQVHPSEDSKCHVCLHEMNTFGAKAYELRPICIYTQQGS